MYSYKKQWSKWSIWENIYIRSDTTLVISSRANVQVTPLVSYKRKVANLRSPCIFQEKCQNFVVSNNKLATQNFGNEFFVRNMQISTKDWVCNVNLWTMVLSCADSHIVFVSIFGNHLEYGIKLAVGMFYE